MIRKSKALAIINAIPQVSIDAATVELSIIRILPGEQDVDGRFMDMTSIFDAFNAIKDNVSPKSRGNYSQTYVSLAAEIGASMVDQLVDGVTAAIAAGAMKSWRNEALETEGLNVNDPGVAAELNALVGNFGIDKPLVDAVLATGFESVLDFSGLKPGHVQNALEMNYRGELT